MRRARRPTDTDIRADPPESRTFIPQLGWDRFAPAVAEVEAIRTKLDDGWRATIGVIFAFFLLTAIGGVQTGTSWDENEHRRYGHAVLSFYSSFGADRTATTDWMGYYGALYTTVATLAEKILPFSHWAFARHVVSAAFGAAALFWTARLGRLLAGKWAGF